MERDRLIFPGLEGAMEETPFLVVEVSLAEDNRVLVRFPLAGIYQVLHREAKKGFSSPPKDLDIFSSYYQEVCFVAKQIKIAASRIREIEDLDLGLPYVGEIWRFNPLEGVFEEVCFDSDKIAKETILNVFLGRDYVEKLDTLVWSKGKKVYALASLGEAGPFFILIKDEEKDGRLVCRVCVANNQGMLDERS